MQITKKRIRKTSPSLEQMVAKLIAEVKELRARAETPQESNKTAAPRTIGQRYAERAAQLHASIVYIVGTMNEAVTVRPHASETYQHPQDLMKHIRRLLATQIDAAVNDALDQAANRTEDLNKRSVIGQFDPR